jgi:hypothetical protein
VYNIEGLNQSLHQDVQNDIQSLTTAISAQTSIAAAPDRHANKRKIKIACNTLWTKLFTMSDLKDR